MCPWVYSMCQGQNDRSVEEYKQIRNEGIAMFISKGDSFTSSQTNSSNQKLPYEKLQLSRHCSPRQLLVFGSSHVYFER